MQSSASQGDRGPPQAFEGAAGSQHTHLSRTPAPWTASRSDGQHGYPRLGHAGHAPGDARPRRAAGAEGGAQCAVAHVDRPADGRPAQPSRLAKAGWLRLQLSAGWSCQAAGQGASVQRPVGRWWCGGGLGPWSVRLRRLAGRSFEQSVCRPAGGRWVGRSLLALRRIDPEVERCRRACISKRDTRELRDQRPTFASVPCDPGRFPIADGPQR